VSFIELVMYLIPGISMVGFVCVVVEKLLRDDTIEQIEE